MSEKRFAVTKVRGGLFPLYEVRDASDNALVDESADREDMQELADAMNSLDEYYKAQA